MNWKIFHELEKTLFNDLCYFKKVNNIRETAKCIYLFPRSREINQFSTFPYTFDFTSKSEKYCTNIFFLREIQKT